MMTMKMMMRMTVVMHDDWVVRWMMIQVECYCCCCCYCYDCDDDDDDDDDDCDCRMMGMMMRIFVVECPFFWMRLLVVVVFVWQ